GTIHPRRVSLSDGRRCPPPMTTTTKPPSCGSKGRMIVAAALLSGVAHAVLLGSPIASAILKARGGEARPPLLQHAHLGERAHRAALPVILAAERRELVARARADLAAGRLELGAFILASNDLDAR